MTFALAFTERATEDVIDAFEWYETQRIGLGDQFLDSLERTLDLARLMPEVGPDVHRGLRRLLMRTFPYAIYYRVADNKIEVRGCLHQRRARRAWRRR